MAENVLVTGGSGFVGAYTVRALAERGDNVVIFDVAQPSRAMQQLLEPVKDQIRFVQGQILDLPTIISTLKRYNIAKIVHAAALFDPQLAIEQPYITFKVNVEGTINILEAARLLDLGRVVHVSTIGVYPVKQYEPMDELHPIFLPTEGHPTGPYGASKACCEIMGLTYHTFQKVDFIALRFSAVYGHGMRYPMYIKPMVENSIRGIPVKFPTGGDMPRDYTYVKDCVRSILLALDADPCRLTQRVFLISGGKVIKAAEAAEIVRQVIPGAQIEIGDGLTEFERSDIKKRGEISIAKAREQLGYVPQYDLRRGISEYADLYREFLAANGQGVL